LTRWGLQKTNITSTSGAARHDHKIKVSTIKQPLRRQARVKPRSKSPFSISQNRSVVIKIFTMILSAAARTLLRSPALTTAARRLACRATLASHATFPGVRNFATV
jgi:hypothetical protein